MSQRGGAVSSQVRYGEDVQSPVIEIGGADILVSFEKMEAMRWLKYLKPEGKIVVNDHEMDSMPILSGIVDYPSGIIEELSSKVKTTVVDATKQAIMLGNPKVMNVILLGTLIKAMGLEKLNWAKIIKDNIKPKFVELNLKAIQVGMNLA